MIREVEYSDLEGLLELYLHLHDKSVPVHDEKKEKNDWLPATYKKKEKRTNAGLYYY